MAANSNNAMEDFEYQLQAQKLVVQEAPGTDQPSQTYTDPSDGTVYEWDAIKRGWFPKIDGMFLAAYHSSYGYHNPEEADSTASSNVTQSTTTEMTGSSVSQGNSGGSLGGNGTEEDEGPPEAKKKKQPSAPGWFDIDESHNTNVYVSGLHEETTVEEFVQLMTKCGIVMNDEQGQPKVKLYHDSQGNFKGDALCCFLKIESVALSVQLLDESQFKGQQIHVEKAKFQMKGEFNPALKKRKKSNKKKKGNTQERLLDWKERKSGPSRSKYDRIVIFKHLFNPADFEKDPTLINEIKDDLREECGKLGEIKKILIFDRNEEGVASVAFKDFEPADQCVLAMNGRFYGGQKLEVEKWDGIVNYEIEESDQQKQERLKQWETYLEKGKQDQATPTSEGPPSTTEAPPTSELPPQTHSTESNSNK